MLPFSVDFRPGEPVYEQVIFAVRKAIAIGQLPPGSRFPSVRTLSQELRINPNTAHKIVATLTADGALAVFPGIGTVIASPKAGTSEDRSSLLELELERLVVEAHRLGLTESQLGTAMKKHWAKLTRKP